MSGRNNNNNNRLSNIEQTYDLPNPNNGVTHVATEVNNSNISQRSPLAYVRRNNNNIPQIGSEEIESLIAAGEITLGPINNMSGTEVGNTNRAVFARPLIPNLTPNVNTEEQIPPIQQNVPNVSNGSVQAIPEQEGFRPRQLPPGAVNAMLQEQQRLQNSMQNIGRMFAQRREARRRAAQNQQHVNPQTPPQNNSGNGPPYRPSTPINELHNSLTINRSNRRNEERTGREPTPQGGGKGKTKKNKNTKKSKKTKKNKNTKKSKKTKKNKKNKNKTKRKTIRRR